jgi:hypothetical protein
MTFNVAFAALVTGAVIAQGAPAQSNAAAIKESLAANQARLRTYSWVETTEVSLKGEVKKNEQKQCYYGADGKVQKTALAGAPAAPAKPSGGGGRRGGGKLKEQIVENKVDEMKDYMEKVVALVHEYVPPDPQKIGAAESAGNVSRGGPGLTVKSYVKPGDVLAIGFDPAAKQLTSYTVQSFVEKPKEDDVKLVVTFGKLEDGTRYPQQIVLNVVAKKLQVKVTNSGYKKAGL